MGAAGRTTVADDSFGFGFFLDLYLIIFLRSCIIQYQW